MMTVVAVIAVPAVPIVRPIIAIVRIRPVRSEERRLGEEGRSQASPCHYKTKRNGSRLDSGAWFKEWCCAYLPPGKLFERGILKEGTRDRPRRLLLLFLIIDISRDAGGGCNGGARRTNCKADNSHSTDTAG